MQTVKLVLVVAVFMPLLLSGCEKTSAQVTDQAVLVPPLNTNVIVTLRTDVLQTGTTVFPPQQPSTTGITAFGTNNVTGTLTAATDRWVVISTTVQDFWIPRDLVVMIQVPKP
jgi:outer membrane murein-binding lipoprotein Lpp